MPDVTAEDIFGTPKTDDDLASQIFGSRQPPASAFAQSDLKKSPVRRFVGGVVDAMNPLPMLGKAAGAVVDLNKDVYDAIKSNAPFTRTVANAKGAIDAVTNMAGINPDEAQAAWDKGDYLGVAKSMLHSPVLENIGEKVGEGDIAGAAGTGAGTVGNAVLMSGVADPLINKATAGIKAKAMEMYQRPYKAQKWFDKLTPNAQQGAMREGIENWVSPTNSGKGQVAALKKSVDTQRIAAEDALANDPSTMRLPVDVLDEAADLTKQKSYTHAPTFARERAMEGVAAKYAENKLKFADPNEILAAKQKIADGLNEHYSNMPPSKPSLGFGMDDTPKIRPFTAADITDDQLKAISFPSTMTPQDIITLKREWRNEITTPEGQLPVSANGAAVDSFINHLAAASNEIVDQANPVLRQIGLRERDLINLQRLVRDAAYNVGKREFGGIATPVAAAGGAVLGAGKVVSKLTGIGQAAIMYQIIRSPFLRTKLASMLYKSSGGLHGLATATGILNTLSEPLLEQEDIDQKKTAAINAGP